IALVIVGFTLLSFRDYLTQVPVVETVEPEAPRILVAKHGLVSGAFVQPQQDLDWQPVPVSQAPENKIDGAPVEIPNYQYENSVNIADFTGSVVRRSIRAGEPITPEMLMKSGEGGFMSAVLEPGMRAVSISVNPISGNAGFVSPGDRVDLLITYRMKGSENPNNASADSIGSETFIRNVRVLAVDQSLDNPENKPILAKTITVEVAPSDAEKISVASEMGKISLSLVSIGIPANTEETGGAVPKLQGYTLDGDVSNLLSKKENATSIVRVIRADKVETLEFYQDKQ
ncbi:MAG: Flp pilus assembly protein CpaB, partial [Rickettsiales bacterium]